ncbi:MAG: hypothetical protein HQL69_21375 [Magnetococcales bacterium]|nr:hypothetical protein [Magnetococcales bacterium]
MAQFLVNQDNYCLAQAWIEERILRYQINVEGWVMAYFLDLPPSPNTDAVMALDHWIQTYLPRKIRLKMWVDLGEKSHKNKDIIISD